MSYSYIAAGVYLVLGFGLTRWIIRSTTLRLGFRDVVIGSAIMPIVILGFLLFILAEKVWKRLLIALDYDPPEEMRAGPEEAEVNLGIPEDDEDQEKKRG